MLPDIRISATIGAVLVALAAANPALAQKQGGVLRLSHFDSPASMSILEESTRCRAANDARFQQPDHV
jgi:peptide/nickel transport system substrate-binding protein